MTSFSPRSLPSFPSPSPTTINDQEDYYQKIIPSSIKEKKEEKYFSEITNGIKEAFNHFERVKVLKDRMKKSNDIINDLQFALDLDNFESQVIDRFKREQQGIKDKYQKVIEQNKQQNIKDTFKMLESKLDLPTMIRICNYLKENCNIEEMALEFQSRRFNWIKQAYTPNNFDEACDFLEYQMVSVFNQFRAIFGKQEEWHYKSLSIFAASCLLIFLDFYQPKLYSIQSLVELRDLWNQLVILDNCTLSKYKLIFMDHLEEDFINKSLLIIDNGLGGIMEKFKYIYLNAIKEGNKYLIQQQRQEEHEQEQEKEEHEQEQEEQEEKEYEQEEKMENNKDKEENKTEQKDAINEAREKERKSRDYSDSPIVKLLDNSLMELISSQMIHFPLYKLKEKVIRLYKEHFEKIKDVLSLELQDHLWNKYIPELLDRVAKIYNESDNNSNIDNNNNDHHYHYQNNNQRPIFGQNNNNKTK